MDFEIGSCKVEERTDRPFGTVARVGGNFDVGPRQRRIGTRPSERVRGRERPRNVHYQSFIRGRMLHYKFNRQAEDARARESGL